MDLVPFAETGDGFRYLKIHQVGSQHCTHCASSPNKHLNQARRAFWHRSGIAYEVPTTASKLTNSLNLPAGCILHVSSDFSSPPPHPTDLGRHIASLPHLVSDNGRIIGSQQQATMVNRESERSLNKQIQFQQK